MYSGVDESTLTTDQRNETVLHILVKKSCATVRTTQYSNEFKNYLNKQGHQLFIHHFIRKKKFIILSFHFDT